MSLRVWLPLDGNLRNQGCSNVTVTNNGATVNTSGKIGSCYAFNGSTGYIALSGNDIFNIFTGGTQQFSITMWVFHADTTRAILFGDYSTTGGIGFNIELSTGHGVRFYWNGSPDTYPSNATVAASAWSHLALTYDGTKIQSYINGIAKGSWTGTLVTKNKTSGEFRLGRDNRSDSTAFNGRMNDFRIYDHCLSAAEVHEISQGLVLHYKLDASGGGFANSNLLTGNVNEASTWTLNQATATNNDGGIRVQITSDTGDRRIYKSVTNVWTPANSTFTVSFEAKAATNNITLNVSRSNIATDMIDFPLTTKWQHYSGQIVNTAATNGGTLSIRCVTNGAIFWIKNVKLERGEIETRFLTSTESSAIIQDSSGYGHNGTINGTLSLTSDTPRYSASTKFSSGSYITHPQLFTMYHATYSFWVKEPSFTSYGAIYSPTGSPSNGTTPWFSANTESSSVWAYFGGNSPNYTKGSGSLSTNTWYHCVYVWNNGVAQWYLNGVATGNSATYTGKTYIQNTTTGSLGDSYTGTSWGGTPFTGQLSDFRIYCTALSAADIKQLYEVGAKVDNLGSIHTFEFTEDGPNKIYKTGITQGQEISEINGMSNLKYDPNVYIEPDGSAWVRIFHHNNPTSYKFASGDTFTTGVYKDANCWFNFDLCNYVDKWEFIVKSKTTPDATEYKYRWSQTKNPLTAAFADVASSAVTKNTTTGYTSYSWGGLYKINSSTFLCTNNGTNGNWWGAVGAWNAHQGGIPGWTTVITTGYEDVYLRIDNITTTMPPIAKSTKNNIWLGRQLIER